MLWVLVLPPALLLAVAVYSWLATRAAEAAYPPVGRFVTVRDRRLHYLDEGEGQPVVLLHGNPGTLQHYTRGVVERLVADFRVIAFDRPGHGYSDRAARDGGSPVAQARMIHEALELLGVERAILVAESWSGALALSYALEYPAAVAALVLVEATFYEEPRLIDPLYHVILAPVVGRLFAYTLALPLGRPRVKRRLATACAPVPVPPDFLRMAERLWTRPKSIRAIATDAVRRASIVETLRAHYPEVRVPVTILAGLSDQFVDPQRQSFRLHRELPHSVLVEVPGAGHLVAETRPEVVADAVRSVALQLATRA